MPTKTLQPTLEILEPSKANPASENCIAKGGTHTIETRGDGGQYGICTFEDNRQYEEWALINSDCPLSGLKVTGYVTLAAQYCAITGGTYSITGNNNTDNEQGTCTFKKGSVCDVWDFYNGKCSADQSTPPTLAVPPGGGPGLLVFDSTRDGLYRDIYVMNSDGSNVKRLTQGEANSFAGPWSPDGKLIAFQTNRDGNWEVYVMNADGSSLLNLTNNPADEQMPIGELKPLLMRPIK